MASAKPRTPWSQHYPELMAERSACPLLPSATATASDLLHLVFGLALIAKAYKAAPPPAVKGHRATPEPPQLLTCLLILAKVLDSYP